MGWTLKALSDRIHLSSTLGELSTDIAGLRDLLEALFIVATSEQRLQFSFFKSPNLPNGRVKSPHEGHSESNFLEHRCAKVATA